MVNASGVSGCHVMGRQVPEKERNKLRQRRETLRSMTRKLHQALANLVEARLDCIQSGNAELRDRHEKCGDQLVQ